MLSISLNFKQLSKCDIINASKPSIKSSDENEVSPIDRKKNLLQYSDSSTIQSFEPRWFFDWGGCVDHC